MRDLKSLWDELAARHRGNATTPRPSGFQLFNRVADDLARTVAGSSRVCSQTQPAELFAIQPSNEERAVLFQSA